MLFLTSHPNIFPSVVAGIITVRIAIQHSTALACVFMCVNIIKNCRYMLIRLINPNRKDNISSRLFCIADTNRNRLWSPVWHHPGMQIPVSYRNNAEWVWSRWYLCVITIRKYARTRNYLCNTTSTSLLRPMKNLTPSATASAILISDPSASARTIMVYVVFRKYFHKYVK